MKEENEGPGLWVPAIRGELKEMTDEDFWNLIESAGQVEVVVESVEKGEGVGSVESVGRFVHTDEQFKRDDSGYESMADEEVSGDEDGEVVNGYGLCGGVAWPRGSKRRFVWRRRRSIRRRFWVCCSSQEEQRRRVCMCKLSWWIAFGDDGYLS